MLLASSFSEEKAELERVLASEAFSKSPNLSRLLQYLCTKCFEGCGQDLKEYNIAVEALGRSSDFDPVTSSIVRVEAHRMREKLKKYYEREAADHSLMIVLEAGHYAPHFVKREEADHVTKRNGTVSAPAENGSVPSVADEEYPVDRDREGEASSDLASRLELNEAQARGARTHLKPGMRLLIPAIALALAIVCVAVFAWRGKTRPPDGSSLAGAAESALGPAATLPGDEVRILAGYSKHNYIDRRGKIWQGDRFFKGGESASSTQAVARTLDPTIFQQYREGDFSYEIPLKRGVYEMRLYFAEPQFGPTTFSGGGESSRVFSIDMNGKPLLVNFDIYSDAGGSNIAYERVFRDVTPGGDGYLRLTFKPALREKPVLNALEIVPAVPGKLNPIRLVARDGSYTDRAGRVWSPDCYFSRGRLATHNGPVQNTPDPDLYTAERFGNFDYAIPVAPGKYGVTLRFAETYFGELNLGAGGKSSRTFNVFCNGIALLRNFDIFAEAGGADRALDKTFHGLEPNAQGLLVLSFVPVENYAEVNAIEVIDESQ